MRFPAHSATEVTHERLALPSISTVHAPHSPSPQPYLQPVSERSSRSTLSRLRLGSAVDSCGCPLMCREVFVATSASFFEGNSNFCGWPPIVARGPARRKRLPL